MRTAACKRWTRILRESHLIFVRTSRALVGRLERLDDCGLSSKRCIGARAQRHRPRYPARTAMKPTPRRLLPGEYTEWIPRTATALKFSSNAVIYPVIPPPRNPSVAVSSPPVSGVGSLVKFTYQIFASESLSGGGESFMGRPRGGTPPQPSCVVPGSTLSTSSDARRSRS